MSTATLINTCTVCGAEESLDALLLRMIDDDQVRRLIADVLTLSLPLGGLVVRYLRLHKPLKQKLRMATVHKVLAELLPDLQRNVIERKGRLWSVTLDSWKAALQSVFDAQDKGTLTLPLEGNGYLYEVLMRMADKAEGAAERQVDSDRRGRAHQGGAKPLAELLDGAGVAGVSGAAAAAQPPVLATQPRPKVDSPTVRAMKAGLAARATTHGAAQ